MAQPTRLRSGRPPESRHIRRVLHKGGTALWLPFELQREQADANTNWESTSDSIALDLARRLNAERLVLVKSCEIEPAASLPQMGRTGIVDARFASLAHGAAFPIDVVHYGELGRMRALLLGQMAYGAA